MLKIQEHFRTNTDCGLISCGYFLSQIEYIDCYERYLMIMKTKHQIIYHSCKQTGRMNPLDDQFLLNNVDFQCGTSKYHITLFFQYY